METDVVNFVNIFPVSQLQRTTRIGPYLFDTPKNILTDQGTNFVSELTQNFENLFRIKHIKTTTFHPQSNGSLEKAHSVLKDLLRTCNEETRYKVAIANKKHKHCQNFMIVLSRPIYEVGQKVEFIDRIPFHNLSLSWKGPGIIRKNLDNNSHMRAYDNKQVRIHTNQLMPYFKCF